MQIAQDVLRVLSSAHVSGKAVTLTGQLDRRLYQSTNKVLEAAGGKWNRKEKAHIFDGDAETRMDEIILTGEVVVPKDEFNFFPTPSGLVDQMIELADIRPGMEVLEPSAGHGAIATKCVAAGAKVTCYEILPANCDLLREKTELTDVHEADFLSQNPDPRFDRVVMNPPFLKQNDIRHVNHALQFLKPNGRLIAIMSAGVEFRVNRLAAEFRQMVAERGGSIEYLPEATFKESGTMVNTVIVVIPA